MMSMSMSLSLAAGPHVQRDIPPTAKAACASLNFSMKVELMHGFGEIDGYSRNSGCGYFCGRKTFRWDNGPQGFGDGSPAGNSTQWPSTLNIAATFDPVLAYEWGVAMGEEWWGKGTNILEGPGINVMRVPYNGRTFEYISGEDPVLGSLLVGPTIDGMQQNAMAIAKHYILNNQETDRSGVNELVDEKTIMELYGPPFEAAAKHKVAGYMCAYNRINGVWACEQPFTLRKMLKGFWNFTGFIVSDWGATHSTSEAVNAGLDIEMPGSKFFNEAKLKASLDDGSLTMEQFDETCVRILSPWYALDPSKRFPCNGERCIDRNVSTPEHKTLARTVSAYSTVLLKNGVVDGSSPGSKPLLPLSKAGTKTIALIGADAETPYTAGGGSGHVDDSNVKVTPLMAFQALGYQVTYATGCKDGKPDTHGAAAVAAAADVAIVFTSAKASEGSDRKSLYLSNVTDSHGGCGYPQEELITAVAAFQPKTVVVMAVPGPILTEWRDSVPSILCAFLPGEQYGNAIADLILGNTVPQAKLPVTMPLTGNDQVRWPLMTLDWPRLTSDDRSQQPCLAPAPARA
jgi:beta-glucosidase